MIYDSSYWKEDLLKVANKLQLRLIQRQWRKRSFYALEKEIFLGFYSIRKLIESRKISDSVKNKKYQILELPRKNKKDLSLIEDHEKDFDFDAAKKVDLTVHQLCNQFIHSFYFAPFLTNGSSLIGLFVCSDYKRASGIYLITIFDVVDIYQTVGNNYPSSMSLEKRSKGKVKVKIE